MKHRKHGFTLAELLIVVAIIAVLVAVAIPIFSKHLERSRESTDLANVRALYAEVMTAAIGDDADAKYNGTAIKIADGVFEATYSPLRQKVNGWDIDIDDKSMGNVPSSAWIGSPEAGGSCTIRYEAVSNLVTVSWSGSGGGGGGGGSGEGGGGGGSDPSAAHDANVATANSIGSQVLALMVANGCGTNAQVTITVHADGSYGVEIKHGDGKVSESEIRAILGSSIDYNGDDTEFTNGFTVQIKRDNGHGEGGHIDIH